jgi:hypothetical protein
MSLKTTSLSHKLSVNGVSAETSGYKSEKRNLSKRRKRPLRPHRRTSMTSMRTITPRKKRPLPKRVAKLKNSLRTEKTPALEAPAGSALRSLWILVARVLREVPAELGRRNSESYCLT